jgi:DNA-binding transcriptional MerR regulator
MTQWYVKDLSKLTGVTVQTLHHYDRINLLKPSVRLANGYRVYSEKDLLQLQQIIALKFFGFELAQIKTLLIDNTGALERFALQAKILEQKATRLLDASQALKSITSDVTDDKSIPWETIIQLIEVYQMTQQLEHSWVKEIFTDEELKQYATFETEFKTQSTAEQQAIFEKNWADLMTELSQHLKQDPRSDIGIRLGEKCMQWVNGVYGKKYAHLRTKKFEKGFGEGKGLDEVGLTPETVAWLDQAIDAYWRHRAYAIFAQVGKVPDSKMLQLWNDMLDDMYGEESERKVTLIHEAIKDDNVSAAAKKWLQSLLKP